MPNTPAGTTTATRPKVLIFTHCPLGTVATRVVELAVPHSTRAPPRAKAEGYRQRMGRGSTARVLVVAGLMAACLSSTEAAASGSAASRRPAFLRSAAVENSAQVDHASSVADARRFLDRMMDLRAGGGVPRLVQSFDGGSLGSRHFTDSETYDDALIIEALVADRTPASLARARIVGNALLFVQQHDPKGDGRIRVAYAPNPLTSPGAIVITDRTSDVGNMAWVAMALARLASITHHADYLNGARRIARWIARNCRDHRGAGGFTGGQAASGRKILWKSTEHNIDLYALYRMLAKQTGDRRWATDASWARHLVEAMWQPTVHNFAVGTGNNGRTLNRDEQPEDVNSWSYLAFRDSTYERSLDWDVRHLSVGGSGFAGVSFCAGDRTGAWYEGTANLAAALDLRGEPGDRARAARYLADIRDAQHHGPNADGQGIIAASKNRLSDCDGDYYFSSLHTGATAWYILAARAVNPFRAP
jgi:hypothetical protein